MVEFVTFKVDGKVVGSARPRVTRHGTYIPKATREYRKLIAAAYTAKAKGRKATGPVTVYIDVFRELPKSRPKKVTGEPDTFKPDVDNIAKNVLDALNGIAWEDDSQVVCMRIKKHPRTRRSEFIEVSVMEDQI